MCLMLHFVHSSQLIFLCDLYSVQSLVEHVVPIALELARSRVSELRLNAHGLVSPLFILYCMYGAVCMCLLCSVA